MRKIAPIERLWVVAILGSVVAGCQQADQTLPFGLEDGESATVTISSTGGVVSVPPSFSMNFPAGSYSGSVTVIPRIDAPFPGDAGFPVPGSAFDVGPVGTTLPILARVDLQVPPELLALGDEVRLGMGLLRADGSVATFEAHYDLTNGILSAEVDELGPIAAVVLADAIEVEDAADVPPLTGGAFSPPTAAPPPPGPQAAPMYGGVEFAASCSPTERRCFASGVVRVWVDEVVRRRLGQNLYLVNAEVDTHLEFLDFDEQTGLPMTVIGEVRINGALRARINSLIAEEDVDELETTGLGEAAAFTTVTFDGSEMTLAETSDGFDALFEYAVKGIGTSEMLTLRVESEILFDNDDGTFETGLIIAHVRLRR